MDGKSPKDKSKVAFDTYSFPLAFALDLVFLFRSYSTSLSLAFGVGLMSTCITFKSVVRPVIDSYRSYSTASICFVISVAVRHWRTNKDIWYMGKCTTDHHLTLRVWLDRTAFARGQCDESPGKDRKGVLDSTCL